MNVTCMDIQRSFVKIYMKIRHAQLELKKIITIPEEFSKIEKLP